LAFLLVTLLLFPGCENQETKQLPEWTPTDHTNQGSPNPGQIDTSKKRAGMEKLEARGVNDVVLAAWKTNCVRCHGNAGQGDGPEGRMLRPPNMSDPTWQRTRIESEMKYAIQNGRGRMPAFAELPEKTVAGLVQLVRMLSRDFDASKLDEESEGTTAPRDVGTGGADQELPDKGPTKAPKAEPRQ
jgi:cytochrome c oxidase cbb3-type subunit 3